MERGESGITGPLASIYDVFVDWEGRLRREMPGIERHLASVGARRVLDVGCGTGRHLAALLERGFDAHGADVSQDMLERARATTGRPERLHAWRLGDDPAPSIAAAGPFDAAILMGNVWPSVRNDAEVTAACSGLLRLVRPGGLVLLGLKAQAWRRSEGEPYLPLLRRAWEGRPVWFVRFVDFEVPALEDGTAVCDLHFVVVAGGSAEAAEDGAAEALLHRVGRHRVWSAHELEERFEREGFRDVRASGRLDDPDAAVVADDVFLSAIRPPGDPAARRPG